MQIKDKTCCKKFAKILRFFKIIYYFQNFTIENNVYKGKILPYTGNYKNLGEMLWTKIKSHGDKIAHVSRYFTSI